jgi:hypothetical protein
MKLKSIGGREQDLSLQIGALLDSGTSRQEIYGILETEYYDKAGLAAIVTATPSQQDFDRSQKLCNYLIASTALHYVFAVACYFFARGSDAKPFTLLGAIALVCLLTLGAGIDLYALCMRRNRKSKNAGFTLSMFVSINMLGNVQFASPIYWAFVAIMITTAVLYFMYQRKLGALYTSNVSRATDGQYIIPEHL